MIKIAFTTLGCKVNQYDTDLIKSSLISQDKKYVIVPFNKEADIYVINTCTVTGKGDAESRRLIRKAHRMNHNARIVVTGCYAQVSPEEISKIEGVTAVLGNLEKSSFVEYLANLDEKSKSIFVSNVFEVDSMEVSGFHLLPAHSRAVLKIQDGCDSRCSYCIVPFARGRSRSLPPNEVIRAINNLHDRGFREVVLCGIHLGGYGRDLRPAVSLEELLQIILKRTSIDRIRLSSIEPREITEGLIELAASEKRICRHFHIPLQSGDDRILKSMNRNYNVAFYENLVFKIRERIPEAGLGCDIMVGYPGEEEEHFNNTLSVIEKLPVTYLHVFSYSPRKGTASYFLEDTIGGDIKQRRSNIIRSIGEKKALAFKKRHIDRIMPVLVEEEVDERTGLFRGYTDNYLRVLIEGGDRSLIRRIVDVDIKNILEETLSGVVSKREIRGRRK